MFYGKIAIEISYVAAYVYRKMIFWGLIQLDCHLIQHVTLIYSPITCLSTKLWSNTTTLINSNNYFYKDCDLPLVNHTMIK